MTRYEQLEKKMYLCLLSARKTRGVMRTLWLKHYNALHNIILNSSLQDLSKTV